MTRRGVFFCLALVCALCAALFPGPAPAAQDDYPPPWPFSGVTVTIPFEKGSEADVLFSLIKPAFEARTGKAMEARYVSGRAGADAWARIVDDPPTGAVLTAVILPDVYLRSTQPDSGVFMESMAVCSVIASMPCALWAEERGAFTTVQAVADAAVGMGGNFMVAGPGRYSTGQLAARALDRETGARSTYVPYTGTGTAAKAVLNRQAGVFWGYSVRAAVPGFEKAAIAPLAVAAGERLPALATVPTFKEQGLNLTESVYIGFAVPADTPKITMQEISEYFSAFVASAEFQAKARNLGFVPVNIPLESMVTFLVGLNSDADRRAESFSLHEQ